ncbi:MAG: prepilin peptidase [Rhodocyclaceae bacterium]|nr:prepilin peptidase [Rhodocyclaceae bacterium]
MTTPISILISILTVACWFDMRERRVPNALILAGMLIAPVLGWAEAGAPGIGSALAGLAAGLAVLLPFFVLRMVGAGDVKLMSVVGGFTGAAALLPIALYTFIAGGLLAAVSLLATRSGAQALSNFRLLLLSMTSRVSGASVTTADLGLKTACRLPYAVAIACGVLAWLLTRN